MDLIWHWEPVVDVPYTSELVNFLQARVPSMKVSYPVQSKSLSQRALQLYEFYTPRSIKSETTVAVQDEFSRVLYLILLYGAIS